METLVIAWSPERAACDALVLDRNGNRRGAVVRDAALDALPAPQGPREVVWIVPGTRVVTVAASLPVKGRDKVLRALPYAVEERFAEDPERLFFALAGTEAGGALEAAAVERAWFEAGLAALTAHGLAPAHALPDYLALPWRPGIWTALADGGLLSVRQAAGLGFTLEAELGWTVLARRLAEEPESDRPAEIRFLLGREPYGAVPALELLAPEPERRADGLLGAVPEALSERAPTLDLIQGAFARRRAWRPLLRPWLPAGAALAAAILLALAGFAAGWVRTAQADAAARRAVRMRFHQVLPGAPWIDESTARAQVTQRLQQLAGGGRRSGLLPLLGALAAAGGQAVTLESVSYRGGSLQVQVHAAAVSGLDAFRAAVAAHGVDATLRSANQSKSGVDGALVITPRGAP